MNDDTSATPDGLLHCLRMLTEEAAILGLDQTFTALKDALEICHIEASARAQTRLRVLTSLAIH
ncbi:MAG: hypothetical protein H7Z10_14995 [Gemmatimonadaceae bacterium]|nr:hypothetical protein [Acetobacteraceae bacterium]